MEELAHTESLKQMSMSADILRDPVLHAAWAYYVEDLSQTAIADRLGVSRASVHNYLRQARMDGVVRVAIDPHMVARSSLAQELSAAAGLDAVYIVPEGTGPAGGRTVTAAAMWLVDLIGPDTVLGVTWGPTVYEIADRLPRATRPGMTVVQLLGSVPSLRNSSAEACATLLARKLGASCLNLHVPAVLSDAALVSALVREPVIAAQLAAVRTCDTALLALGHIDGRTRVLQTTVASEQELEHYRAKGAQAVAVGRFLDADGQPIPGPLDGRIIGITLEELRQVPRRIAVCVGSDRVSSLTSLLRAGLVTHLITDETAARGACEALAGRPPAAA